MKDISMGFPFRLDNLGGVASVEIGSVQHIEENITQILTTRKGERAMLPNYGCELDYSVFENIEVPLYNILRREIVTSLTSQENRIIVKDEDISIEAKDNTVTISMKYIIKVDGSLHNYELQLS